MAKADRGGGCGGAVQAVHGEAVPVRPPSHPARSTVGAKLLVMVLMLVAIVAVLLFVMIFSLRLSASVRSYVTGEGLWTRAQKDAVHHLDRYAWTHDESDYRAYLASIGVILGDRAARLEMDRPGYDYAAVQRGFVAGGNNPRDVPDLIFLYRNFQSVSYLARAISIWRSGDLLVDELQRQAGELHQAVSQSAPPARVDQQLLEIARINARLAPLETEFSGALADGARWAYGALSFTGVALTLALLLAGVWAAWHIGRQIRAGVRRLVEGAAAVSAGNLDHQIESPARDELGDLARDFNRMIMQRKRAEAELTQRAAQLARSESANEAKSRFLAAMSHEIRTPMNGLLGLLELHEGTGLSDAQRESVRMMRGSAETLLTVLDDILDFSKVEAGQLRLESVPMSLRETVESALETLAPAAGSKGLRLVCFVDPQLPAKVLGDPVRIRQVLLNLCSNAIKFTETGQVTVELRADDPRADPVRLRCTVRDTGIGVPGEAQERLFKPFSQAESSTTRRYGGTGLGLSICKGLIERMGGRIGLSSAEGAGSQFWFELDCKVAEPGLENPLWTLLRGVRVRVDCADADEAGMMRTYLESAGALPAAPDEAPQLVLRDQQHSGVALVARDGGSHILGRPVRYSGLLREAARLCGRQPPASVAAEPAGQPAVRHAARVLVAEDHPTNRQVISLQLERLGFSVTLVDNGREALLQLEQGRYALLYTDLHMPELDGISLVREIRLRETSGTRRLPVIGLTADVLPATVERCRAAGMDEVLRKPASLAEHERVLKRWLGAASAAQT